MADVGGVGRGIGLDGEVVDQILTVDEEKVLSALELVLRRLPQNIGKAFVAGDLGGAYQTVGELIERGLAIGSLTHHHIISIAGHEGIGASQHGGMGVGRHKAQRSTTIGAKGIELGQRTLVDQRRTAIERQTVGLGIGELTLAQLHFGIDGIKAVAAIVMHYGIGQTDHRTISHDAIPRAMYLRIGKETALSLRSHLDASPLTADAIVGQIVEHVIQAVATEQATLGIETPLNKQTGVAMEEQSGILQRQRSFRGNGDAIAIKHQRLGRLDGGIALNDEIGQLDGIPAVGAQIDTLLYPTLEREEQIVLDELGLCGMVLKRGNLDEHAQAVALANLEVLTYGVEEGAVDIDTETGLVALLQTCGADAQTIGGMVVNPEGIGDGGHGRKERVEQYGIARKGQAAAAVGRKRIVVGTGRQQQHR